ncbi:MAG: DUF1893 domain-containing protein [Bacteroidales bacterium]
MDRLIEMLRVGNHSCVIESGDEVRSFMHRGVIDIYELLVNEPSFLKGARIADKVVGKAAASLMILGGVTHLHTEVISEMALELLQSNGVVVSYSKVVPYIINREGNDWCPLEKASFEINSADEIFPIIDSFLKRVMYKIEA